MTQHKKAQQIASAYHRHLLKNGCNLSFAWNQAMALFKLEMQK